MKLEIAAKSINEGFARSAVAAFALFLNPSVSDLSDIKTAVSEAVTNAVVHAYEKESEENTVTIECETQFLGSESDCFGILHIRISDNGCGIEDIGIS